MTALRLVRQSAAGGAGSPGAQRCRTQRCSARHQGGAPPPTGALAAAGRHLAGMPYRITLGALLNQYLQSLPSVGCNQSRSPEKSLRGSTTEGTARSAAKPFEITSRSPLHAAVRAADKGRSRSPTTTPHSYSGGRQGSAAAAAPAPRSRSPIATPRGCAGSQQSHSRPPTTTPRGCSGNQQGRQQRPHLRLAHDRRSPLHAAAQPASQQGRPRSPTDHHSTRLFGGRQGRSRSPTTTPHSCSAADWAVR
jgi:hypothetical protein